MIKLGQYNILRVSRVAEFGLYLTDGITRPDWNAKTNVISRKDIDILYLHHVIHSLTIARFLGDLKDGTTMLDMGTGGGFPGIPLAIMYPACRFHLIDRIGKKVRVAQEIASAIGLTNVTFQHGDIGECRCGCWARGTAFATSWCAFATSRRRARARTCIAWGASKPLCAWWRAARV